MRSRILFRSLGRILVVIFLVQTILMPASFSQGPLALSGLDPATALTSRPCRLQGVNIYPNDPFLLQFIVDKGDARFSDQDFRKESERLIAYFLASLTVPEKEMWVNLSPYEKDRIVPEGFGRTTMGHDLLAQDYVLKQMASALLDPEKALGQTFWSRVYRQAQDQFGTTEIPLDTFNKVWIVPEGAVLYEHEKGAVIVQGRLKVMHEEDYLALEANTGSTEHGLGRTTAEDLRRASQVSLSIMKEILIPELTREVNEGAAFARLRQVYHSLLLANWYKQRLQESLLARVYADKQKTGGVAIPDPAMNKKIYEQYVAQFKRGAFNYIREDVDPLTGDITPRRYFSGGVDFTHQAAMISRTPENLPEGTFSAVDARLAPLVSPGNTPVTRRGFLSMAALFAAWGSLKPLTLPAATVADGGGAALAKPKPVYQMEPELGLFYDGRVKSGVMKGWPLSYGGDQIGFAADWMKTGTELAPVLDFALIQQREHADFTLIDSLISRYSSNGYFFYRGNKYYYLDAKGRKTKLNGLPLELPRILNRTAKKWYDTWDWGVNTTDTADMINLALDAYKLTKKTRYLTFAKSLALTLAKLEDLVNGGLRYGPMGVYYSPNGGATVDSNFFYNLKTTEANLKALHAYLNLYDATKDQKHLTIALNTWRWLIGMYNGGAAVFHQAELFSASGWAKTELGTDREQFSTFTTAWMPISLLLNDDSPAANAAFGVTLEERDAVIREMIAATDRRTAFMGPSGVAGYAVSDEAKGYNMLSPEAGSEMALCFLHLTEAYQDTDPVRAAEYRGRYEELLRNTEALFSDHNGYRVAPVAIDAATGRAAPSSGFTGHLGTGTSFHKAATGIDGMRTKEGRELAMARAGAGDGLSYGGIDLNPAIGSTKIERNSQGIIVPVAVGGTLDERIMSQDFSGFMPVILRMSPARDLSTLIGGK